MACTNLSGHKRPPSLQVESPRKLRATDSEHSGRFTPVRGNDSDTRPLVPIAAAEFINEHVSQRFNESSGPVMLFLMLYNAATGRPVFKLSLVNASHALQEVTNACVLVDNYCPTVGELPTCAVLGVYELASEKAFEQLKDAVVDFGADAMALTKNVTNLYESNINSFIAIVKAASCPAVRNKYVNPLLGSDEDTITLDGVAICVTLPTITSPTVSNTPFPVSDIYYNRTSRVGPQVDLDYNSDASNDPPHAPSTISESHCVESTWNDEYDSQEEMTGYDSCGSDY
jgi:hypothetical protein